MLKYLNKKAAAFGDRSYTVYFKYYQATTTR